MKTQKIGADIAYLKSFDDQDGNTLAISGFNTLVVIAYISNTNTKVSEYALSPTGEQRQLLTEDSNTVKWYVLDTDIEDYPNAKLDFVYNATVSNVDLTGDQNLQDSDLNIIIVEQR